MFRCRPSLHYVTYVRHNNPYGTVQRQIHIIHNHLIGGWRSFYMSTCTGSMWQIGFGTSSPSQSTDVCTLKRRSTWQTAASLSGILRVVNDYAQHTVANWMCHGINVRLLAGGRSPLLDQLFGTRFLMNSEISLNKYFGNNWKHCFLDNISLLSALEVFVRQCAL